MGGEQSKASAVSKTSRTTRGTKGERATAGSSASLVDRTPGQKTFRYNDEDREDGIVGEGLLGEGRFLEVPRRAHNVCGMFEEKFLIMEPIDDQMERDLAIYLCFYFTENNEAVQTVWAYVASPEATRRDAKESFEAFLRVSLALDAKEAADCQRIVQIPKCIMKGRLKRLVFGIEEFQQYEHDPDWTDRPAMVVDMPAGVFIASLLPNSPFGVIEPWIALIIGLGLVKSLHALHQLGFVHRYVTPWNFVLRTPFSLENFRDKIMHADLSLATEWPTKKNKHIDFAGTRKYSSIRALTRHVQGPADDFISVIYIVAELISGKLPWRAAKTVADATPLHHEFKDHVCFKRLPKEIRVLYHELNRIPGTKSPEYDKVEQAFIKALDKKDVNYALNEIPDWMQMPGSSS